MAPTTETAPARARWGLLLNTVIVALGYLLSRLLGLVRDVIISARFGTLPELDAFRAAFGILDLLYLVVAGGALGSAFIPVFAGLLAADRRDDAWRLANGVLHLALLALLVAGGLLALLAEPLVALTVGRGFDPANQALTASILRLLLLQPLLLGLGGLAKATLESFDRFALPALGSNLYNLGIIAGALLLAPWLGIYGLAWGVVVGAALFLLVQLPGLRALDARYLPTLALDLPAVRQVGRLLAPRLFGQSAWQLNLIATLSFATLLGPGAVAANGFAFQLMLLPHGLIALSLGTVIFPQLARHYAADDLAALREAALGALRQVIFLALPAAVLLGLLATQVVQLLFQRGAFDASSSALTAQALACYALGLVAYAGAEIVVRTFYAMQDTRTPVLVGIGVVALNIGLAWLLLGWGLAGLALAFSLAALLELATLLVLLRQRLGRFGAAFWRALAAMALAALAFGLLVGLLLVLSRTWLPSVPLGAAYRWPGDFLPLGLWLVLVAAIGAAGYVAVAAWCGLPEVRSSLARLAALAGRIRR